jgi:Mrp family chromosome partitioning ATPase
VDDDKKKRPWRQSDTVKDRPRDRPAPGSQILHISDEELGLHEVETPSLDDAPPEDPVEKTQLGQEPTLQDHPTPALPPRRVGRGLVKVSSDRFHPAPAQGTGPDTGEQPDTLPFVSRSDEQALVPMQSHGERHTPQGGSRLAVISRTGRHRVRRPDEETLEGPGSGRHARRREAEPVVPPELQLEAPSRVTIRMVDKIVPDPGLMVMTDPGSLAAEQYRVLSLKLKEHEALRVMAVLTPTEAADGCLAAANVALALAEGSRSRVVLLDANLRSNEVGTLFGLLTASEDLGQQLHLHQRNPEAPWEILALGRAFHLIPASPMKGNPAAMLNSETMWDLMNELRQYFDYIVITAPPVMEAADGVIMQDHVDSTLLVARAGASRADALRGSLKRLGEGKVIGTVLLDVKPPARV